MDLIDVLRSTGAVREFTSAPVGDEVVARILDNARFAPSGANAQAWHVVSVRDPAVRVRLRELYQPGWRDYLAMGAAGLRPWAPTNDRDAETAAMASVSEEVALAAAQGFAAHLDRAPVLLVVFDRSGRAGRRRPRHRPVFVCRRRLGLSIRVERSAGGPRRGTRRCAHHDADPAGATGEATAGCATDLGAGRSPGAGPPGRTGPASAAAPGAGLRDRRPGGRAAAGQHRPTECVAPATVDDVIARTGRPVTHFSVA